MCDDGWGQTQAAVVCRQLGLTGGVALTNNDFGPGLDPIWLDSVVCTGDEATLAACHHQNWAENDCAHFEDVSVVCGKDLETLNQ